MLKIMNSLLHQYCLVTCEVSITILFSSKEGLAWLGAPKDAMPVFWV